MKRIQQTLRRGLSAVTLLLLDGSLLAFAMVFSFWLRLSSRAFSFSPEFRPHMPSYWFAFCLALYLVLVQLAASQSYLHDRFRTWHDDTYSIIKAVSFTILLLLALSFFYRGVSYSRQMVFIAWPLAIAAMAFGRAAYRLMLTGLRRYGYLNRKAVLLGQGSMAPLIEQNLSEEEKLGIQLVGFISEDGAPRSAISNLSHLGELQDLEKIIGGKDIQLIFLALENTHHEKVLSIIEICERHEVELLLVPEVFDLLVNTSGLRDLHGMPMMELREEPIQLKSLIAKRLIDFSLGTVLLIVSLPVQLIIAILIRLDSPGPALFFQKRVGYRGGSFRMWKFRTMGVDAEEKLGGMINREQMKEPVFKFANDPRITRLGKWLRKSSLDELPQLFNVVWGEMSLVGPRPEEESLVLRYNVWQRRRLKVKPGITGLQQIKCRGCPSLAERVKYDIYYIRRMSVLLDLEILVRTIWVVLSQKGAY